MQLYQHQIKGLEETADFNRVAYYWDMGLGKTFVGSEKMMQMLTSLNLVICQKSKVQDWIDHFKQNYSDHPYLTNIYDLTNKKDMERFIGIVKGYSRYMEMEDELTGETYLVDNPDPVQYIGIINYDLVWRRKDLMKLKDFTLMLDESSLIQNHTAKRTRFILKLQPDNVILLSGTPTAGRYERLWTQMHLLGWPISRKLYDETYVIWDYIDVPGSGCIIPVVKGYKNIPRLKRRMREYGCSFLKTDECFDLPAQQDITLRIDPSSDYKRFMRDRYLVMTDGRELIGDTSLTARIYARQLCGQYHKAKLAAVKDLIESTEERLIIFYNFNAERDLLRGICGDRPVSEVSGSRKDLDAYESNSDSVTLIQYQAGAYGLNLQKCRRIIYFTLPESSELFEQSKKRIHRIGQDRTCFYYYPICAGSIETRIMATLKKRKDYTDALFKKDFGKEK